MPIRTRAATALATLFLLAMPAVDASARQAPKPAPHTIVIVLENREYEQVIGNPEAPFLNDLARRGALATRYHGITHPSLPNYLALLGGSTFGITENCTDCWASGSSLAQQLSRAGISWRAYMEGLPHPCFGGAQIGDYVKRHNPFMYFPAIARVPKRCRQVVPATRLDADLRRGSLPTFAWLSPDLCSNAHDCGIDIPDRILADLVPRMTRQLGPAGLLVITFDEGTTDRACCGVATGGRVMTILIGPEVRGGARLTHPLTHYSLLATIEDRYGLPRLRHARSSKSLRAAFDPTALK